MTSRQLDLQELSLFARSLAERAGKIIVQEREGQSLTRSLKAGSELVTSADLKSDELIRNEIQKKFPDHKILSEESSPDLEGWSEGPLWIIDPIDGTVNYSYGHIQAAVCIAFALDGVVQVGVVHVPFANETFQAIKGRGATLNSKPIRASQATELRSALIGTGFPYEKADSIDLLMKRFRAVMLGCRDIRRVGSAAIDTCWVAMGRLDGYYETVKPWDIAAAGLIASEAGAKKTNLKPLPKGIPQDLFSEDVLIAAPEIHDALKKLLLNA